MPARTVQLVLAYDGARFAGWQRQPDERTVQGVLEEVLGKLCGAPVAALGAGRTDAGVHARGQAAGVRVPEKWGPLELRRALNGLLPDDVWVASAHEMRPEFHARYSATARRYSYVVGTDEGARSPFRRRWELAERRAIDPALLASEAAVLPGEHSFRAFAVQKTAPQDDHHRCIVRLAAWRRRTSGGPGGGGDGSGAVFEIEANRFLHHMVRFLVGTMLDVAAGKREPGTIARLLDAPDNRDVSSPAAPQALFLERVEYPPELYLSGP